MTFTPFEWIQLTWIGLSIIFLLVWLARTQYGRLALCNAYRREHDLTVVDMLFVAVVYIVASGVGLFFAKDGDEPGDTQFATYAATAAGQIVIAVVAAIVARRAFRHGLKGLGTGDITTAATTTTTTTAITAATDATTAEQRGTQTQTDTPPGTPAASVAEKGLSFSILQLIQGLGYFFAATGLTWATLAVTQLICQSIGYSDIQRHSFLEALGDNPPGAVVALLIVTPTLLAPVAEELLFRGLLQSFLIRFFRSCAPSTSKSGSGPRWQGIFVTAVIFALLHGNWQHWPALIVLAVFLGYVYERRNDIVLVMFIHGLFNALHVAVTLTGLG